MGVSGQHHAPAALYPPEKVPPVPIGQEAGWAPEPVWTQRLEEKSSASVGDRTPVAQSVVRHCTDWATRLPFRYVNQFKIINNCVFREMPSIKSLCRRKEKVEKRRNKFAETYTHKCLCEHWTEQQYVSLLHGKLPHVLFNWVWLLWFSSGIKSTYKWTICSLQDTGSFRKQFSSTRLTQR
jgi:hypothetical protein